MKWADFFHAGTKLAKLKVLGKPGSWDTAQNAISQSDYRSFKSTISLDSWKIEVDRKNIGVGMVNFRCDHSVLRTLKLAVYQIKKKKKKKKFGFWCVDTNSWKLKITLTIFGWWWSKIVVTFKVLEL